MTDLLKSDKIGLKKNKNMDPISSGPTLFLPRLNCRIIGQPSRLYFESQSGKTFIKKSNNINKNNSQIRKNISSNNLFKRKFVPCSTNTSKTDTNKSYQKLINFNYSSYNKTSTPKNNRNDSNSKHLKLLLESDSNKNIILKTERTGYVNVNFKNKFLQDASYSPVGTEYFKNNISYLLPVNTCSFNSSKFLNTNSEVYEETLWSAFDNIQNKFEKNVKSDLDIRLVDRSKNFLLERNVLRKSLIWQKECIEKIDDVKNDLDQSAKVSEISNLKILDKKFNKVAERIKKIKVSKLIKGRIIADIK